MKNTSVYDCQLIHLPKIENPAGNLTAVENSVHLPFEVKRVYYLYDVPSGQERGGHAHKELQQLIIAASGAFDVLIDDGRTKKVVRLDRPNMGLHILPGIWRELLNFSSGSVSLVLASHPYDEDDYMRDFECFKNRKYES